jgi:hypothetical protein
MCFEEDPPVVLLETQFIISTPYSPRYGVEFFKGAINKTALTILFIIQMPIAKKIIPPQQNFQPNKIHLVFFHICSSMNDQ